MAFGIDYRDIIEEEDECLCQGKPGEVLKKNKRERKSGSFNAHRGEMETM